MQVFGFILCLYIFNTWYQATVCMTISITIFIRTGRIANFGLYLSLHCHLSSGSFSTSWLLDSYCGSFLTDLFCFLVFIIWHILHPTWHNKTFWRKYHYSKQRPFCPQDKGLVLFLSGSCLSQHHIPRALSLNMLTAHFLHCHSVSTIFISGVLWSEMSCESH